MTHLLRWPALLVVASGCGVELPSPEVQSIVPTWAYNGEQTQVLIRGDQFYPRVEVDVGRRGPPDVDDDFRVNLIGPAGAASPVSYALVGVQLTDWSTLEGVVDVGLRPGVYDVEVISPTGRRGLLPEGFFASDTRADRLGLEAELPLYTVNDIAQVEVSLLDPTEQRVFQDLPVEVWVERDGALITPSHFDFGGWEGASVDPTGQILSGTLGDDGFARVWLSVPDPGKVNVFASPATARSGVRDGSLPLVWATSDDVRVQLSLPEAPFVATAGVPFEIGLRLEDEFGNLVLDQSRQVLLWSTCSALAQIVNIDLRGERTVEVEVRRATAADTDCVQERIVVFNGGFLSEPFQVLPAELARIGVLKPNGPHAAGAEVSAVMQPTDAFGNPTDFAGPYEVSDSVGGVESFECVGLFCRFVPIVASEGVELVVNTARGVSGRSEPYAVVPGAPARAALEVSRSEVRAGDPLESVVLLWDAYNNAIPSSNVELVSLESDLGDADCEVFDGSTDDLWLRCQLTVAREAAVLSGEVAVDGHAFAVEGDAVLVVNGTLTSVAVDASAGSVVAGEELTVTIAGFDAYGNPYTTHTDPLLALLDSAGSAAPATIELDADGRASAPMRFVVSGATEVIARQYGVDLGRSAPIGVLAGPAIGVKLDVPAWVEVGVEAAIGVRVIDAFGNTAPVDGLATLGAASGAVPEVQVNVVSGRGLGGLTWPGPMVDERVELDLSGLEPGDAPTHVYASCDDGPVAALQFASGSDARSCFDAGTERARVDADLSASTPGSGPLTRFGLRVLGGEGAVGPGPLVATQVAAVGRYDLEGFVMDATGCGAVTHGVAWVGPDDGSAVGRLQLTADAETLLAGEQTTMRLAPALTCGGGIAAGAEVKVRSTRGLLPAGTPTGSGLSFVLDDAGTLVFPLANGLPDGAGEAEVVVWSSHLAASGGSTVRFEGDALAPQVVAQAPSGAWPNLVDVVEVWFSEPVDTASAPAAAFTLSGSLSGPRPGAIVAVAFEDDGRRATLTLDAPLDGAAEAWTLTIARTLTDLEGNGLDGRWTGLAADYSSVFGAVPLDPAEAPGCFASPSRFRPDGDHGTGEEVDEGVFSFQAARQPARWVVQVFDPNERAVRVERLAPLGAVDAWLWDGRDQTGAVLANGAWRMEVRSDDGFGNLSPPCLSTIILDNRGSL